MDLFHLIKTDANYELKTAKLNYIKSLRVCETSTHIHINRTLKLGETTLSKDLIIDNIMKIQNNTRKSESPKLRRK